MDDRIRQLIDAAKSKFGLNSYFLHNYSFERDVNIYNETVYRLCMEWLPEHMAEKEDDGSNPEGTAAIEVDLKTGRYKSVIFVMGKTYAENGTAFREGKRDDVIKWVEAETGLAYGEQFILVKEEGGRLLFKGCLNGIEYFPSGMIECELDEKGNLILFSVHGEFPPMEMAEKERYDLSLEKIEHIGKKQFKLLHFPSFEDEKIFPIYAMEEVFITNDGKTTIPFEPFVNEGLIRSEIGHILEWEEDLGTKFIRKEIDWSETVTAEQAFVFEPSPDTMPISIDEKEQCINEVRNLLRQEYPNDSGKWMLKTVFRDKGYIHAVLKREEQNSVIFQRKLNVFIDPKSLKAVNYIDNGFLLEAAGHFEKGEEIKIHKEEAFEKAKPFITLKPVYVFDFEKKRYILCGKLDCRFAIKASNGEAVEL